MVGVSAALLWFALKSKKKKVQENTFREVDQFWCMKCGRTRGWNISSEEKGKVF